jgi:hypothetical protein
MMPHGVSLPESSGDSPDLGDIDVALQVTSVRDERDPACRTHAPHPLGERGGELLRAAREAQRPQEAAGTSGLPQTGDQEADGVIIHAPNSR